MELQFLQVVWKNSLGVYKLGDDCIWKFHGINWRFDGRKL